MVRAWAEGCASIQPHHIVDHPHGIAAALLRGNPGGCYPYVYEIVRDSRGTMSSVSEAEIREAKDLLYACENLHCGYEGAATVAALRNLAASKTVGPSDVVLLNLTS
jgi:threonine synthase